MRLCVLKNTLERENATAAGMGTDGMGGAAPSAEGGEKIYKPQKKHKHSQYLPNLIKMQLRTGLIS